MELSRKTVDKVLGLKKTVDIITDKKPIRLKYDADLVSDIEAKLKISIASYKNTDGDLIVITIVKMYYVDHRLLFFNIKLNANNGAFLINLIRPQRYWSGEGVVFYDKNDVLDKMNFLTSRAFEDVNKAILDLMSSYIK